MITRLPQELSLQIVGYFLPSVKILEKYKGRECCKLLLSHIKAYDPETIANLRLVNHEINCLIDTAHCSEQSRLSYIDVSRVYHYFQPKNSEVNRVVMSSDGLDPFSRFKKEDPENVVVSLDDCTFELPESHMCSRVHYETDKDQINSKKLYAICFEGENYLAKVYDIKDSQHPKLLGTFKELPDVGYIGPKTLNETQTEAMKTVEAMMVELL